MLKEPLPITEAEVMKQYAIQHNVPEDTIFIEASGLDTVGNTLFTKKQLVVPNNWEHIALVTSQSHLPRAKEIFEHVYGKDFEIFGIPAPENVTAKTKAYEIIGSMMVREVLRGTKPGDDDAIMERLFKLVPGYSQATITNLAINSLLGYFKKRNN